MALMAEMPSCEFNQTAGMQSPNQMIPYNQEMFSMDSAVQFQWVEITVEEIDEKSVKICGGKRRLVKVG